MQKISLKSPTSLAIVSLAILTLNQTALAEENANASVDNLYDEITHFIDQSTIDGDIRNYFFSRNFNEVPHAFDDPSQEAYSLGGNIRILTAPFLGGFQAGAALYTAQDLGLNSDNLKHVDQTLPGDSITVLGQLYLQYKRGDFLIRGGDQLINTPWLGPSDSRMIPATYRGFYGAWTPNPDLTISALRVFEFKSRVADGFSATNLYNPSNLGQGIAELSDKTNAGTQALGLNYKTEKMVGQLWAYQFFDFSKMLYGDAQYTFKNHSSVQPLIGIQALTEGGDGDNILAQVANGPANSNALGAIAGIEIPAARVTIAWNKVFSEEGAFKNGDIVSPYTAGYASDPLYTTSMIAGLVEKAPGNAVKIMGTVFVFDKELALSASYAKYYTQPFFVNTAETDFDITYLFKSKPLKGLSIRNRLGIQTGDPSKGTFYYNRVMLQYSF